MPAAGTDILNALSVDVEDYYHVNAFKGVIDRKDWDSYPRRVHDNTRRILDFLDELDTRATFFVLGWVAERHPDLVREIASRPVKESQDVTDAVARQAPGTWLPLTVARGGGQIDLVAKFPPAP